MARRIKRQVYIPDREYFFEELPSESQKEARLQEDDFVVAFDAPPEQLMYRFSIFPEVQSWEILEENLGRHLEDLLVDQRIHALARKIAKAGEILPVLGEEGLDRAVAAALLGWDLPVFQPTHAILPITEPVFLPPSLEGRRRR